MKKAAVLLTIPFLLLSNYEPMPEPVIVEAIPVEVAVLTPVPVIEPEVTEKPAAA